jgi:hypothetical protein
MSSFVLTTVIGLLIVSPLMIPIGVTVVDALVTSLAKRRVTAGAHLAHTAQTMVRRPADAENPIHARSLDLVAA